jgi:hypothetical protein
VTKLSRRITLEFFSVLTNQHCYLEEICLEKLSADKKIDSFPIQFLGNKISLKTKKIIFLKKTWLTKKKIVRAQFNQNHNSKCFLYFKQEIFNGVKM